MLIDGQLLANDASCCFTLVSVRIWWIADSLASPRGIGFVPNANHGQIPQEPTLPSSCCDFWLVIVMMGYPGIKPVQCGSITNCNCWLIHLCNFLALLGLNQWAPRTISASDPMWLQHVPWIKHMDTHWLLLGLETVHLSTIDHVFLGWSLIYAVGWTCFYHGESITHCGVGYHLRRRIRISPAIACTVAAIAAVPTQVPYHSVAAQFIWGICATRRSQKLRWGSGSEWPVTIRHL